jgi:hypothetical protein
MNIHAYQRQVIAYHGCDYSVAQAVLTRDTGLQQSRKSHDWLGHGVYFWEHGPDRARQWAEAKAKQGEIDKPAVLGALIHLGNCFDLLDTHFTGLLGQAWRQLQQSLRLTGECLPENQPRDPMDSFKLLRRLDCFVLNWTLKRIEASNGIPFDSVRGIFQEGPLAFPDSMIHAQSHIQIAVRNPACIVGFFAPNFPKP